MDFIFSRSFVYGLERVHLALSTAPLSLWTTHWPLPYLSFSHHHCQAHLLRIKFSYRNTHYRFILSFHACYHASLSLVTSCLSVTALLFLPLLLHTCTAHCCTVGSHIGLTSPLPLSCTHCLWVFTCTACNTALLLDTHATYHCHWRSHCLPLHCPLHTPPGGGSGRISALQFSRLCLLLLHSSSGSSLFLSS